MSGECQLCGDQHAELSCPTATHEQKERHCGEHLCRGCGRELDERVHDQVLRPPPEHTMWVPIGLCGKCYEMDPGIVRRLKAELWRTPGQIQAEEFRTRVYRGCPDYDFCDGWDIAVVLGADRRAELISKLAEGFAPAWPTIVDHRTLYGVGNGERLLHEALLRADIPVIDPRTLTETPRLDMGVRLQMVAIHSMTYEADRLAVHAAELYDVARQATEVLYEELTKRQAHALGQSIPFEIVALSRPELVYRETNNRLQFNAQLWSVLLAQDPAWVDQEFPVGQYVRPNALAEGPPYGEQDDQ